MKIIGKILMLFFLAVVLTSCDVTKSTSTYSPEDVQAQVKDRSVIVFGEKSFVESAVQVLEDAGATVTVAGNYALALSAAVPDDIVEIHCINKADGQPIIIQASHAAEVYKDYRCTNGVIFENFVTTDLPDAFYD